MKKRSVIFISYFLSINYTALLGADLFLSKEDSSVVVTENAWQDIDTSLYSNRTNSADSHMVGSCDSLKTLNSLKSDTVVSVPVLSSIDRVSEAHKTQDYSGVSIEVLLDGDVLSIANRDRLPEVEGAMFVWYRNQIEIDRGSRYLLVANPVPPGVYKVELYYEGALFYEVERSLESKQLVKVLPGKLRAHESFSVVNGDFRSFEMYSMTGKAVDAKYAIEQDRIVVDGVHERGCYLIHVQSNTGERYRFKVIIK